VAGIRLRSATEAACEQERNRNRESGGLHALSRYVVLRIDVLRFRCGR
jgi:hypothetical protein